MEITQILLLSFAIVFVIVVPITINKFVKKNKSSQKNNSNTGNGNSQVSGEKNTAYSIGSITNNYAATPPLKENTTKPEPSVDQIKSELRVIFVDDKKFNVVDLLKKSGWKQVSYKRDILDLDAVEVRDAHVFFLDINGVGVSMGFHNQGMGLCGALKRKYGDNKRVVLYSGETSGDIFDNDARMADDTLKKDSDLYQFTALMEQYGKELL